jgi:hypothetical protein
MLVLLIAGIYKYTSEMASCGMIYIPSVMKSDKGNQAILRFCLSILRDCNVGNIDERDLSSVPLRSTQVA